MKTCKMQIGLACALLGAVCITASAIGQPAPTGLPPAPTQPSAADAPGAPKPQAVSGVVDSYNLDPRGAYNGVVIKDGTHITQLNMPPDVAATIASAAPVGQRVQATGMPETVVGDRAILRLVGLTTADGKQFTLARPGDRQVVHVDGTVKQLNYAPRGEVDGAILDTGDFIHVGPRDAAALNLAVGQKISADGWGRPMLASHNAIEATKVNGTMIEHPRPPGPRNDGDRGPGPRGPHGMRGDGPEGFDGGMGGREGGPRGQGPDGRPPMPPGGFEPPADK
jgi:hypothetical protein